MKVLALIMVFVASTSAKGVCSPDQVAACNLQAQTLTKYHATSTEDLCGLCDLCVSSDVSKLNVPECSTFCSVGKAACIATLAGGRDLCPKCSGSYAIAYPIGYPFFG